MITLIPNLNDLEGCSQQLWQAYLEEDVTAKLKAGLSNVLYIKVSRE